MEGLLPGRRFNRFLGGRRRPWPLSGKQKRIGFAAHRRGPIKLSRIDSRQQNRQTRRSQRRRASKFLWPFSNDHRKGNVVYFSQFRS